MTKIIVFEGIRLTIKKMTIQFNESILYASTNNNQALYSTTRHKNARFVINICNDRDLKKRRS